MWFVCFWMACWPSIVFLKKNVMFWIIIMVSNKVDAGKWFSSLFFENKAIVSHFFICSNSLLCTKIDFYLRYFHRFLHDFSKFIDFSIFKSPTCWFVFSVCFVHLHTLSAVQFSSNNFIFWSDYDKSPFKIITCCQ